MHRTLPPAAAAFAAALALGLAAAAPPARAGTVAVSTHDFDFGSKPSAAELAQWTGAKGERNALTVTREGGALVFRDAAAPLAAGSGCQARADGAVACRRGGSVNTAAFAPLLGVDAGDGDDTVTLIGSEQAPLAYAWARGGAGADAIELRGDVGAGTVDGSIAGGSGDDLLRAGDEEVRIYGGEGDDRLLGSPGDDRLLGSPGDDRLSGDDGEDRLDGGAGRDDLSGGAGRDELHGGDGDDHLDGRGWSELYAPRADRDPDALHGDRGDDELVGGFSADTLRGDDGPNRLDGGHYGRDWLPMDARIDESLRRGDRLHGRDGDDLLRNASAARENVGRRPGMIVCGAGADVVAPPRGGDTLASDCEAVGLPGLRLSAWSLGRDALLLHAERTAGAGAYARSCGLALELSGTGSRHLRPARRGIRLPRGGARAITLVADVGRLPRRVRVTVRLGRCDGGARERGPAAAGAIALVLRR